MYIYIYIILFCLTGGGEFGDVCRGRLKIPPNFVQDIDVAIKTLKPGIYIITFFTDLLMYNIFLIINVLMFSKVLRKKHVVIF